MEIVTQSVNGARDLTAWGCFRTASLLTDPVCIAHRTFREAKSVHKGLARARSAMTSLAAASAAAVTSMPGVFLRVVGMILQSTPFIYESSEGEEPVIRESCFSLLFWNVVGMNSGHVYTNAGVTPFLGDRVDKVAQAIIQKNADVVCLCEMMDLASCLALKKRLKKAGYKDFYYNIGAAAAVSSGIFVASKIKTARPRFTPFASSSGRTYFQKKGVFSFDVLNEVTGKAIARVFATHPQHSEECSAPTEEEKQVREAQIEVIRQEMEEEEICSVLTGDLNLPTEEYKQAGWKSFFDEGWYPSEVTWDGDHYSATLAGQEPSMPQWLDHTLVKKGTGQVSTSHLPTGFDPMKLCPNALSDHRGLYSKIWTYPSLWRHPLKRLER